MSENKNAKTPTDDGQVAHVYLFDKTGRPMVAWDNAKDIKLGDKLYAAPKQWVGLTDEEIDALSQAPSLTDELMDCVDRLGSEADTVDPRVWQHLLVYAPKPKHEPVAWMFVNEDGECEQIEYGPVFDDPGVTPLYTSPPKREWVGLTDEERHSIREWQEIQKELGPVWAPMMLYLYLAVEAKLKEKNT